MTYNADGKGYRAVVGAGFNDTTKAFGTNRIVIFYNSPFIQKNDRLSLNTNRRFCRYFSGFVPKRCQDTSSWIFGCPSACAPQKNPAH